MKNIKEFTFHDRLPINRDEIQFKTLNLLPAKKVKPTLRAYK